MHLSTATMKRLLQVVFISPACYNSQYTRMHTFLELNKAIFLLDEMLFNTTFATNRAKNILYRHILCSCRDAIYSKSIKKNHKKSQF